MNLVEGTIPLTPDEMVELDIWVEGRVLSLSRRDPGEQGPLVVTSTTGEWLVESDGTVIPLG